MCEHHDDHDDYDYYDIDHIDDDHGPVDHCPDHCADDDRAIDHGPHYCAVDDRGTNLDGGHHCSRHDHRCRGRRYHRNTSEHPRPDGYEQLPVDRDRLLFVVIGAFIELSARRRHA